MSSDYQYEQAMAWKGMPTMEPQQRTETIDYITAKHFRAMFDLLTDFNRTIDADHFYADRLHEVINDLKKEMPWIQERRTL